MAPSAILHEASPPPIDLAVKMAHKGGHPSKDIAKSIASATVVEVIQDPVTKALRDARIRFAARNPRSFECHIRSTRSMPGGNTRTMLHTAPYPVFLKSGKGYQVTSEDGHMYALFLVFPREQLARPDTQNRYTDFVGELTAGLYGHSNPIILETIQRTLSEVGMSLGGQTSQEHVHALAMCERFGLDSVRFTNCGTEANIHALAVARAYTRRRKVIVFGGGYHGGVLMFAGGKPASNVIDRDDFIVLPYNDSEALKNTIDDSVAAVLVEGMQGCAGAIVGKPEFLFAIQDEARKVRCAYFLIHWQPQQVAEIVLQA